MARKAGVWCRAGCMGLLFLRTPRLQLVTTAAASGCRWEKGWAAGRWCQITYALGDSSLEHNERFVWALGHLSRSGHGTGQWRRTAALFEPSLLPPSFRRTISHEILNQAVCPEERESYFLPFWLYLGWAFGTSRILTVREVACLPALLAVAPWFS